MSDSAKPPIEDIEAFDKDTLKHVETMEREVLPDKESE